MVTFDRKPRPSAAKGALQPPPHASPVSPLGFRLATSTNAGAAVSPAMTEERRRYFEPLLPHSSVPWSRIGRATSEADVEVEASPPIAPGPQFDFARITSVPPPVLLKATINSPGDPYEREADEVAHKVMRMAEPIGSAPAAIQRAPAAIQQKCAACQEEEKGPRVQRRAEPGSSHDVDYAPPIVEQVVGGSGGRRLDAGVRAHFEPRFGVDFSKVRVHTDARADASARAVNALAYTVGQNIVFSAGRYAPESPAGKQLLAHELTHVVQQSLGGVTPSSSSAATELEADADKAAIAAVTGGNSMKADAMGARAARGSAADSGSKAAPDPSRSAAIQRKADPAAVAKLAPAAIRADPDYIDNGLVRMSFYGAEEADLYYSDGAVLHIGLVPRWIKAPFESVDYHTARSDMAEVMDDPRTLKFIPKVREIPGEVPYSEALAEYSKSVNFTVDANSGKIVPNHVNPVTAPFLCTFLLKAEAEYVANFDAMAKGMVKVFKAMEIVLELALFKATLPVTGGAKVPTGGGVGAVGARAFDAAKVAEELYVATKAVAHPGERMLSAATKLSGMTELTGAQKVPTILEFFKRIGFIINKEGVKDVGEFFLMKSDDAKYAFRIIKETGKIVYGSKFDVTKLDYIWRVL